MENMDKGLTMVADKSAENTPNAPKFICPNCLLGILMKKGFIARP